MFKKLFVSIFTFVILSNFAHAQREMGVRPTQSGGVLMAEQAVYDVKHYDLALRVNPDEQSINGVLTVKAQIVKPTSVFVLDLDSAFKVETVNLVNSRKPFALKFGHENGKIWIRFPTEQKIGKTVEISVAYGGKPKVAPRPPWVGGFVWSKTKDGAHWFATAVQMDGSDLWFPVKDHPSDKADTTNLHFTVPDNLIAASNGKLQSVVDNKNGTKTFNWFISQPISNYNIALNVAPYKVIEDKMQSVAGDEIPIVFYVLPEHADKGQGLIDKTKDYVRFFEKYLGPYPFRADKLGIAHTPHLGMEHQSIIAYGNDFNYDKNGFDWLMFHELGHEWWANLVTAPDWNDFWIHEGFQSFMDAFYAETILGREQFVKSLPNRIKATKNLKPLAPREAKSTTEMYMIPPDFVRSDGDIYGKGALVLNTLRGLLGDDPDREWLEFVDVGTGRYRGAVLVDGRLLASLFVSPTHELPPRNWLAGLFAVQELGAAERASLLVGRPGGGQRDCGRIVCACFGVGLNTLTAAIRERGLTTPEAIGATLKAGTNCGSCVPELRQLIARV